MHPINPVWARSTSSASTRRRRVAVWAQMLTCDRHRSRWRDRLADSAEPTVMLYVESDNVAAVRTYERLGFTHLQRRHRLRGGPPQLTRTACSTLIVHLASPTRSATASAHTFATTWQPPLGDGQRRPHASEMRQEARSVRLDQVGQSAGRGWHWRGDRAAH